jgi:hypothetical protein
MGTITIAVTTPLVFGLGTLILVRRGSMSFSSAAVAFIFGASMAGTAIGAAALLAGDAGTKVVGTGVKSVQEDMMGGGGGGAAKPPIAEKNAGNG